MTNTDIYGAKAPVKPNPIPMIFSLMVETDRRQDILIDCVWGFRVLYLETMYTWNGFSTTRKKNHSNVVVV